MKIYAPNSDYTGVTAGIAFAGGVGEVKKDDHQRIQWFREHGFGIGKKSDAEEQVDHENLKGSVKSLSEMSNAELDEVGKGKGIVGISSMKQADKIKAIQEADSVEE